MVSLAQVQAAIEFGQGTEYLGLANLNLYDSPALQGLVTQSVVGRQLRIGRQAEPHPNALQVQLCEDDYPGWLPTEDLDLLELAETNYQATSLTQAEISERLPQVIAYTYQAMSQPNYYLWGGTVGPNYDCSGLMQTAFAALGIWLPRDAYQQEEFLQPIDCSELQPGDLVFFGKTNPARPNRATHVGLYLGDNHYIHSSGKSQGRNGIGIDELSDSAQVDVVSQAYYRQLRGAGRVVKSYMPVWEKLE
jgi:cell wall-associated NlpC family hydrolase